MTTNISTDKRKLVIAVSLLLTFGFALIAMMTYLSSRTAVRESIAASTLPLTSDNIYSEIQKDLLRPVLLSSFMSSDIFLHDWVKSGERDIELITRYLREIKERYGTVTSFFVSERTRKYYQADGVLKSMDPDDSRDAWYFRVKDMTAPYELNVDPDAANKNVLTIFINYRALDPGGSYIGAAGVGLTVESVRHLVETYQERYQRSVSFVDKRGIITLSARSDESQGQSITSIEGLGLIAPEILKQGAGTYRYTSRGNDQVLNVRFIPELDWYLFVTQDEHKALAGIQHQLYIELAVSALITIVVLLLTTLTIGRYQKRLEDMATTDKLTGLANRQAFDLLVPQALREAARNNTPLLAILIDIDEFKLVNDRFGHSVGDTVIMQIGQVIQQSLRSSDLVFRWGGEEYLVVAKSRPEDEGRILADKIRSAVDGRKIDHPDHDFSVTISAGVAAHREAESVDEWLSRADRALYASKAQGRNVVHVG